ncbi:hypothetical protein [Niabella drilacis]|uniref:LTXXQ motif family protein n=1 Tax=Niabella drilacis (strain DSM 25811 / CCM 8410 / CCUG 62505 / LMG 26954 / E90) TaxID=1285928 RepID=A0A1G7AEL1_NIADE|nr:hypothetical protein [Niabella drilacis]SDE12306.1 hypothetical protein SAMN04487894_12238 [Niabella drilacis]
MRLRLNRSFFFWAGLLLMAIPGVAQDIPSRVNEGVRRMESKREQYSSYLKLGLTADQKNRLVALQKEGRAALAVIRNDTTLTSAAKKEKLQVLQQQQAQKRNDILTPEQQRIWKEESRARNKQVRVTVDQQRSSAGGDKDRSTLPGGVRERAAGLNLSAVQQQKLDTLRMDFKAKARSIRQDPALSADEKKIRMASLKKEARKKQKAVLTPAQWQQWIKRDENRNSISKQ